MSDRDVVIGTRIAGYAIESFVGRGGMSVVYLATSDDGRRVALKLLSPQLLENARFRDRFGRESEIAKSLDHPNIVPVFETGEADGTLFIAMRYVEGTDLSALVRAEGPLPAERTLGLIEQIAAGLDAAHRAGLVHRDVKPSNVLVERGADHGTDHAYLSDFGLTKRALSVSGFTATGELVGTVDYVAPEQIRGDPLDGMADVYSLGALLVECLTGHVPFPRDAEVATLWAHIQDPPPRIEPERPEVPPGIDDVVARAMAKLPGDRYASAGELASDFRECVSRAHHKPIRRKRWRPAAERRRRRIGAGVATLIVLAAGIGVFGLTRPGPPIVPGVNTLAGIDAASRSFEVAIDVGDGPNGVAVGEGSVWVISQDDRVIQRIDPDAEDQISPKSTNGPPTGVAAGEGAAWVSTGLSGESGGSRVQQVNLNTNDVTPLPFDAPSGGQAIATGAGWVWLTDPNRDRVWQIDPTTEDVVAKISVGDGTGKAGPDAIAVVEGANPVVWVANAQGASISRIDVNDTGHVETFPMPAAPDGIAADPTTVWVTSQATDRVYRLNASDGSIEQEIVAPDGPVAVAIGPDGPWVCSYVAGVVSRIDPSTDRVAERLIVDGSPVSIAAGGSGQLWVVIRRV